MSDQKLMSFKIDKSNREGLKAFARDKYRGNMTQAINEILRDKLKRVKK